jgi:hypothetical protein
MSSLQIIQEELESMATENSAPAITSSSTPSNVNTNNSAPGSSSSLVPVNVQYNGKCLDFAQAGWKIMRGKTVYILRHCSGTLFYYI